MNNYTGSASPLLPIAMADHDQDCTYTTAGSAIDSIDCDTPFPCAVCLQDTVSGSSRLKLKGMCSSNIDRVKWFDHYYYAHGHRNHKPHFA